VIHGKRLVVVLPAYNAEHTLRATVAAIPAGVVDAVILVDDASADGTVREAHALGLPTIVHPENRGYGGNQKTCYRAALADGADIVVMLHPDAQYDPRLVPALAWPVAVGRYDIVLGTRMSGRGPLHGGMPLYKYVANRVLTATENVLLGRSLSEWHTGFRAFSRAALEALPVDRNSDDFVFDNQVLVQAVHLGLEIGEVSCPAHYPPGASSIGGARAVRYGFGVLTAAAQYRLARLGLLRPALLEGLPRGP
jgi:glycosyltransferase involved in cell wall biosynthesis